MRKVETLLLTTALLAALVYSQVVMPQTTQQKSPYIGITVLQNPPVVYPGGLAQLNVVLTTTTPVGPVDVQISSSDLVVLTGGLYKLAGLAPGSPVTLTAVVKAPLGLSPGDYGVTVSLVNPVNGVQFESVTYNVEVYPLDYGALAHPIVKGPLAPGEVLQLPVLLVNPTADIVKASVALTGGPFSQYSNASLSCWTYIPPSSNSTCFIPVQVKNGLEPGSYTAYINVTYQDTVDNSTISFSKNFTVLVAAPVSFNIGLIPQGPVVPGQPSTMLLSVSTGGPTQPTNVTIIPLNTSDVTFISRPIRLPILSSIQVPLEAIVNKYGAITASFEICYFSSVCVVENASLYIPNPDLAINVAQNPPWAYPGSIVQLTIALSTNQPMGPFRVSVSSDDLVVLEGSSFRLPGLAPGSPVTLTALVQVPSDLSPGRYPLTIRAGGYNYTYYIDVKQGGLSIAATANPPIAYPGGIVTLSIILSSDAQLRGVRVNVTTPLQVLEGSSYYLPLLPSGSPITLTSVIKVPDGLQPGDYPVYVSAGGISDVVYIHVESASVIVQNIAVEPPTIVAGGLLPFVKAVVYLLNTGLVPARDVVVALSGAPVVGNSTINIGTLPPGQPVQVPFLINASALAPGSRNLAVLVSWLGGSTSATSSITVLPKAYLNVTYSVSNAQPGSTAIVTVTVKNLGPVPAKMVTLQWTPNQVFQIHTPSSATPTANLLQSSMRLLGDIYPGQSVTTTYLIDVSSNVPSGVYYATLVLEWNETGALTPVIETVQIPITVKSSLNLLEVGPLAAAAIVVVVGVVIYLRRSKKSA